MPTAKEIYQMILNLRGTDEQERMNAIDNILIISEALGIKRTIDELIPYLMESASFTETQWISVLNKISEIPLTGATPKQLLRTISTVSLACDMNSRGIREAGIGAVSKMLRDIASGKITPILSKVFTTMVNSESAALKASAITILGNVMDILDVSTQADMFSRYSKLEDDDAVMVRVAWVTAASEIVKHVKGSYVPSLLGTMTKLAGDKSCPICCSIPKFMESFVKKHGQVEKVISLGQKLLEHPNWRVRCEYVMKIGSIYSKDNVDFSSIFEILSTAVNDSEDEVKTAAAENLPFLATLNDIKGSDVTKLFTEFFESTCPHVKTSAVKSLPLFVSHITSEFLGSQLPKMAKDESQEVKITAIEALRSDAIPVSMKVECIKESAKSTDWREKASLAKLIPMIFVDEAVTEFSEVIVQLLFDDAHDVRKEVLGELPRLVFRAGEKIKTHILAALEKNIESDDYQIRQTTVRAVVKGDMWTSSSGKKILEKAAKDCVANVRLVVADALPRTNDFTSILQNLKADDDEEVREAAQM